MLSKAMADITVFITEPSEACTRVNRVLDERGFEYSVEMIETPEQMAALTEQTGLMRCPIVVIGDTVLGGLREVLDADRSGRLAELASG
jgi:glutaredoxin